MELTVENFLLGYGMYTVAEDNRRFGGSYRLHLEDKIQTKEATEKKLPTLNLPLA
jgi:hypothetical protein